MRKASFYDIKSDAKAAMKGHMGEVILVGLILPIAFSLISNFFNGLLEFVHWSIPMMLTTFTSAISSYITFRMLVKISRYKSDKIFTNFFGTKKGIKNTLGYGLLLSLVSVVYLIIFWDYAIFMWDVLEFIQTDAYLNNPELLDAYITNYDIPALSNIVIIVTIVYSLLLLIVSIRFSFTLFILGDTDENIFESLKKSWRITKGNWWRIVLFPLSFILWSFVVLITLGIATVYVAPYMAVSQASLYNHLLKEQNIEFDDGIVNKVDSVEDENALDVDENKFDKEDPFSDYYK